MVGTATFILMLLSNEARFVLLCVVVDVSPVVYRYDEDNKPTKAEVKLQRLLLKGSESDFGMMIKHIISFHF